MNRHSGALKLFPAGVVAVMSLTASSAFGQTTALFTFGYTDLHGAFDGASTWSMQTTEETAGDVTRGVPPRATADFDAGFAGGVADFTLDMTITSVGANSAHGKGTFVITDADGDVITGNFSGDWIRLDSNDSAFAGLITSSFVHPTGNGTFDGTHGGSVSMDFSAFGAAPFNGSIVVLEAAGWFNGGAFADLNSLVQGTVVPAPGAALAAFMGLGMVGWAARRRSASPAGERSAP